MTLIEKMITRKIIDLFANTFNGKEIKDLLVFYQSLTHVY